MTRSTLPTVRRRIARRAFVAVAAVALLVAGTTAASAKPISPATEPAGAVPGDYRTWTDLFAAQERLNAAAEKISANAGAGLAGIVAAPENRELRVYWKGAVPAVLTGLAATTGVPVTFKPAKFSMREMGAEAARLAALPGVASAGPKADGSGVSVTLVRGSESSARATVAGGARLPVDYTVGDRVELMLGRQADTTPFWGGARYNTPVGGCSTGFAVSWAGANRIISAGHCGSNGQNATVPGWGTAGPIINDNDSRDTLMINASTSGRIYTGAYNASTSVGVGGAVSDFVGNIICTGGASSGEHCNIQVQAVNQYVNVGYVIGPMTYGVQLNGTCAVAPGDSGGPVYSYRADGRVDARGTVSAGTSNVSCPGVSPVGSTIVFYAPLLGGSGYVGSLNFYGAAIVTG
ncbi:hypothetical protein AB0J86_00880 [Micromonospora sp. NPDC049559]|uniref:hypothetical protein n=1 Tax=Micromonospora sp. NPDC049559 TaxID=3155923 RepID=UPI003441BF3C